MRIAECGVRNGGTEFGSQEAKGKNSTSEDRIQKVKNMNPFPFIFDLQNIVLFSRVHENRFSWVKVRVQRADSAAA